MKVQMGLNCELILINDEPGNELPIEAGKYSWGEIIVCNHKKNQGIHGARQSGAKQARGQYIVFLDQDDKIAGDYLISQRKKIENSDAVVCNGYITESGKGVKWYIYAFQAEQENVSILEEYLSQGNLIISPGQVLLRKKAIPETWLSRTVKANGADDFLLWILMLFQGKNFVINTECLYVHFGHEGNMSKQTEVMHESIKEVILIMQESAKLFGIHEEQLEELRRWRLRKEEIERKGRQMRAKPGRIDKIINCWACLKEHNISFADFFEKRGIERLAIYGLKHIGGRLFIELQNTGVEVVCGIDRLADRMFMDDLPIVKFEDERTREYMQQIDAVVVTAGSAFGQIKKMVEEDYENIIIFSFDEIIQELMLGLENM